MPVTMQTAAQEEAWGIAFDLIEELGLQDALIWADDYLNNLHAQGDAFGASRWRLVTGAFTALGGATTH